MYITIIHNIHFLNVSLKPRDLCDILLTERQMLYQYSYFFKIDAMASVTPQDCLASILASTTPNLSKNQLNCRHFDVFHGLFALVAIYLQNMIMSFASNEDFLQDASKIIQWFMRNFAQTQTSKNFVVYLRLLADGEQPQICCSNKEQLN